ncbi:MAG: hypothetical protein A2144_01365 [Chloroflexi bacterium RBG_16_50_9]|nr:MAG: hypothetical protein A2144_01365 [Chloroflexi bacterium RBG_16_50_9]
MGTRPRTKALKANQLKGELKGDLAAYEKFGLFQRSVNQNTAYRYRGALLRYQIFLGENPPSLAATCEYLGLLRKNGFDPSTLRVYRAALAGYHQWRNEELKFKVKVPETSVKYIPWEIIQRMLELASAKPHDELILRLMTDAGLRRDEVVHLKLNNLEGSKLRFRGKGGKERMVPMTDELQKLVDQFSAGRPRDAYLVELGEKGVYLMVKRYGALAGMTQDKFVATIEAHYQGRRLMRRKLGALHEMAKASIGIAAGARSVASEIAFLVEKLALIKGHIGTIERTLVKLVDETEEGKYLLSITGLNYIAVAGLLAELGCFRSYRTA